MRFFTVSADCEACRHQVTLCVAADRRPRAGDVYEFACVHCGKRQYQPSRPYEEVVGAPEDAVFPVVFPGAAG